MKKKVVVKPVKTEEDDVLDLVQKLDKEEDERSTMGDDAD